MDPHARTALQKKMRGGEMNTDNPRPFEVNTQQVDIAISQLSEEVLDMIFSHLKTTCEAHPVSNASPQFARIMSPTKPVWTFDQVFPLVFSELDKKDILNCRLVCKQWNQVIDNTLQSCPENRELTLYPEVSHTERSNGSLHAPQFPPCYIQKALFALNLLYPFQIRNFMERMGDHPRNPLVLRSVLMDNFNAAEDFWGLVISFLERFGTDVWHGNIGSDMDIPEDLPFMCSYEMACQVLGRVPNLKTLTVLGTVDGPANRPLPRLPQLETLELIPNSDNQPFLNELMRSYSRQLKLISLNDLSVWQRHNLLPALPRVTTIQLTINVNRTFWRRFCHNLVTPKLAKLGIHMRKAWKMEDLLQPLLAANLQSVEYLNLLFFQRPKINNNANLDAPQFTLPNIKTLEILDNAQVLYNELFWYLPNLEYLLVCHYQRDGVPNVDFDDLEQWYLFDWFDGESIYSSNIWTRLSTLKELTLARLGNNEGSTDNEMEIMDRKTFTREMYNRLREN